MQHQDEERLGSIRDCIRSFVKEEGKCPTIREIEEKTGISRSAVQRYLKTLEERGELVRQSSTYSTARSTFTIDDMVKVPLVGRIPCGPLTEEYEDVEEYVALPTSLIGKGEFYLLTASGNSMINAGIEDGDLVLIKRQNYARQGDIVVALVDNEVTLKTYYFDQKNGCVRLHPENPFMKDIIVSHCEIQGIAVRSIKNLER